MSGRNWQQLFRRMYPSVWIQVSVCKRVIGDRSVNDAHLESRVGMSSSLFRIEIDDGVELTFPGWISVSGGEVCLQLPLVRGTSKRI
jgi:hypothetical protein